MCILHFGEALQDQGSNPDCGKWLADYVLTYADGSTDTRPIRRRFEVQSYNVAWRRWPYAAVDSHMSSPVIGHTGAGIRRKPGRGSVWLYAMPNPHPDKPLRRLDLALCADEPIAVLGVTLFRGRAHPLRHLPRRYFKLLLPAGSAANPSEIGAELDMGHVTNVRAALAWQPDRWMKSRHRGLGEADSTQAGTRRLLLEMTGAEDAELTVKVPGAGRSTVSYGDAVSEGKAKSADGRVRLEAVHREKTWVYVTVTDGSTGQPTPTRIHFRGRHGEYLPPHGHAAEVNTTFLDHRAGDLKLGGTNYAYVPGRFQIDLPVGDVYVEVVKGFEHEPVRKRLTIRPGQRELKLTIGRAANWRADNWVTADTHVHAINPQTAWLEGQAEGLNLINILATQFGNMFTNVADITGDQSGVSRDGTMVWVGTENRNHLLGHISLLGTRGDPVYPICGGGIDEAYFGDPDMMTLTEWARVCREREGVVIRPHFPIPSCEEPVYALNGEIDGIELRPFFGRGQGLDLFDFREYYRYLNCGARLAVVGGTDKMSATMPVGGTRTYAQLDPNDEFTFENWGKAVRAGRTFSTSGPLLEFTVEGRALGETVRMPAGGGRLEVYARATSIWPIHRLEVVANGKVVASTTSRRDRKVLSLRAKVDVADSTWLAARCGSRHVVWLYGPVRLGAHSSPIYVEVNGRKPFSVADAEYMMTLIDGGLSYLENLAVRYDAKRHRAMKRVFVDARSKLAAQIHAHTHPHSH